MTMVRLLPEVQVPCDSRSPGEEKRGCRFKISVFAASGTNVVGVTGV